jgi:hypothetical protein
MKKEFRNNLIKNIEKIYNKYEFYLNNKNMIINDNPKIPISFLGLEFFEAKKYRISNYCVKKSKIRIRADRNKLINLLIKKRVIMKIGKLSPYAVRNTSKHQKNIKKKN